MFNFNASLPPRVPGRVIPGLAPMQPDIAPAFPLAGGTPYVMHRGFGARRPRPAGADMLAVRPVAQLSTRRCQPQPCPLKRQEGKA